MRNTTMTKQLGPVDYVWQIELNNWLKENRMDLDENYNIDIDREYRKEVVGKTSLLSLFQAIYDKGHDDGQRYVVECE